MVNHSPTVWSGYNSLIKSPPEQPPLSNRNAYTTWPGGVDPTVPLYNTDNQKFGGARRRKSRRASRKSRRASRKSRRNNNVNRKVNRKGRRASRRSRRVSRKHRGGYATCSPIDTTGSRADIPMSASVCPEGYFKTLDTLIL
jgi:hypothetical protein